MKAFERKCGIIDKNCMPYAFILLIETETANFGLSAKEV
jgi:hypothetical protein